MGAKIDWQSVTSQIELGADQLRVPLSSSALVKLGDYLQLLYRWNQTYNLTAVRDPQQMVEQHLLDSLSIADYLTGERCIDVGTGAGLPGMVLAIALPGRQWTLLDTNGKKIRFLRQVLIELGIKDVELAHQRVERFTPAAPFDTVVTRAVTSVSELWSKCRHLLSCSGCMLAMKGKSPWLELPEGGLVDANTSCIQLTVPGLDAERHLIKIEPQSSSLSKL